MSYFFLFFSFFLLVFFFFTTKGMLVTTLYECVHTCTRCTYRHDLPRMPIRMHSVVFRQLSLILRDHTTSPCLFVSLQCSLRQPNYQLLTNGNLSSSVFSWANVISLVCRLCRRLSRDAALFYEKLTSGDGSLRYKALCCTDGR